MRVLAILVILFFSLAVKAQTYLPFNSIGYGQQSLFGANNLSNDNITNKKWFLSKYSGLSTSYSFFKGGYASVIAAPIGLQLNRKLNNNLYAFAGISAAPAYISFSRSFISSDMNKAYPNSNLFRTGNLGMYSRAEIGLMYINDEKTFSISGSIGVQRSSYPVFPYQQMNAVKPNTVNRANN